MLFSISLIRERRNNNVIYKVHQVLIFFININSYLDFERIYSEAFLLEINVVFYFPN